MNPEALYKLGGCIVDNLKSHGVNLPEDEGKNRMIWTMSIVYQASLTFLVAHTGTHTRPPCLDDEGLQYNAVTILTMAVK